MLFTRDDDPFKKSRWIEEKYARQLRQVAREIGLMTRRHDPLTLSGLEALQQALGRYAHHIKPWALRIAEQTAAALDRQDRAMWMRQAREIHAGLKELIENQPAGATLQDFLDRQVHYITSLPLEAGERVQALAKEAVIGGRRHAEIAAEIMRSGEVSASRATLIARTEVARTASLLTQTRAEAIGATHYVWRTSQDSHVRASHKAMQGQVCELANPPLLSDGTRTHPGQIFNCRCTMRIIVPDL